MSASPSHPVLSAVALAKLEAKYFQVGHIDKDQMKDCAKRSGKTLEEAERWLAPNSWH
jgi:5-methyltetrahydrofolate--homocysteine methyltransferase